MEDLGKRIALRLETVTPAALEGARVEGNKIISGIFRVAIFDEPTVQEQIVDALAASLKFVADGRKLRAEEPLVMRLAERFADCAEIGFIAFARLDA
jgi:hypothetical protein